MRKISGFYRIPELADNRIGMVATFGEIDRQRLTYSKEERNYKFPDCPKTELVTFEVIDETNKPTTVTTQLMKRIVEVGEWITGQHLSGVIPAQPEAAKFYAALTTEFSDLAWIGIGTLVRSATNSYHMPTHVEFTTTDSGYEYHTKVWLAGENFAEEYEPYEIFIIPPLDDIDQFINNAVTVNGLLAANTPKRVLEKYNAERGENPLTRLDNYDLTWHDPNDSSSRIPTSWSYLAWGIRGTNVESIKIAIRNLLATESDYENWPDIFPSLYSESDFTIIPWWDTIAVPETNLDQNLYASYLTMKGRTDIVKEIVPTGYGTKAMVDKHIEENLQTFSTFYRGMMLGVISNPSNLNKTLLLSQLYPDYTNEPLTSPDFERMDPNTREFAESLNEALEVARTLVSSDTIPPKFVRVNRDGMVYVSFQFLDFHYMILTRDSYSKRTTKQKPKKKGVK